MSDQWHLVKNFSLMANLDADKELGQLSDESELDLLRLAINISSDFQPQAKEQNKRIEVDAPSFEGLASGRNVLAEKALVSQALSNVLENAIKYSNVGSTIAVSAVKDSGVGVAVTSLGIPIEASDKDKVFERGFRGQKAKQSVAPGTGIGLYLAKRIMTLHGGDITLGMQGNIVRFVLFFPKSRFL
jgi:signal transduction histidine kinase